jgi:nucleotide-binding universal stress UspA family protein
LYTPIGAEKMQRSHPMFKKILVPLDGSALAAAALLPASALAKRANGELVLVGATSTPHVAEIGAYLATMVNCLSAEGLTAHAVIPQGSPDEEITKEVEFACADLIVMTTHGHTGLDALLHPSLTWRVLARTSAPILVTRFAEDEQQEPPVHQLPFMTDPTAPILVPLDGTTSAERVLPLVHNIAIEYGNPIVLVRAEDPLLLAEGAGAQDLAHGSMAGYWIEEAEAYLHQKETELMRAGLRVTSIVELGSPAEVIQATAQAYHSGLIIMASHGRGWLGRLILGNVTRTVLSEAETPLLLVRRFEAVPVEKVETERVLVGAGAR